MFPIDSLCNFKLVTFGLTALNTDKEFLKVNFMHDRDRFLAVSSMLTTKKKRIFICFFFLLIFFWRQGVAARLTEEKRCALLTKIFRSNGMVSGTSQNKLQYVL